jgi:hypothetical protein
MNAKALSRIETIAPRAALAQAASQWRLKAIDLRKPPTATPQSRRVAAMLDSFAADCERALARLGGGIHDP